MDGATAGARASTYLNLGAPLPLLLRGLEERLWSKQHVEAKRAVSEYQHLGREKSASVDAATERGPCLFSMPRT